MLIVAGIVVGLVLGIFGLLYAFEGDYPALGLIGFIVGAMMFFGGIIHGSIEADKEHCLKDLPQISQTETKWLNGECYVKANDGKFVPQEWIEEGYNK